MRRDPGVADHALSQANGKAPLGSTKEMLAARRHHGKALAEFRQAQNRTIHGLDESTLVDASRVVVTGGTGCIGTAVLRHLRARGVSDLTSISRHLPMPERRIPHVDYRAIDVRDMPKMVSVLSRERPELVIHLAGQRQPALAEREVAETVSSNVFGTMSVLAAAGQAGIPRVVTASTGKALRFYASEVYAASKKLAEYVVSQGPSRWGVSCATVRFTHVIDNSIVYQRCLEWARRGEPILLHSPDIAFYAQSACEAAQLLLATAVPKPGGPTIAAITDIGWPNELLDIALDLIEEAGSSSEILFTGYEPGYEMETFPGTFDPRDAVHSPLFNFLETEAVVGPLGPIESVALPTSEDPDLDRALAALESSWRRNKSADHLREQLNLASVALLKRSFSDARADQLLEIWSMARENANRTYEHQVVAKHLSAAVESAARERLAV